MKTFKQFINESVEEDNFELKYELWPIKDGRSSEGYKSWVLYNNDKPVAGISNDSKDKNNVVVHHIETFEKNKGYAKKLIFMLLDNGVILSTGEGGYNSISSLAYKMNKDIVEMIKSNPKYGFEIIGLANNEGKEDEPIYKDVSGVNTKEDNYHYKYFKK